MRSLLVITNSDAGTSDEERLAEARALIREINLGGTAVGTGLNANGEPNMVCTCPAIKSLMPGAAPR